MKNFLNNQKNNLYNELKFYFLATAKYLKEENWTIYFFQQKYRKLLKVSFNSNQILRLNKSHIF
jgi:hypothetical protein